MSRIVLLFLAASGPSFLIAESAKPSIGYTGALADHGGQNCSVCHSSLGAANSDTSGSLKVAIENYNPGVQQMIQVTVNHPSATRWGFQMTIREESDETLESGSFVPPNSGAVYQVACDDGSQFGAEPPCNAKVNGGREFSEHINAPRTSAGAGYTWYIPWNPPANEIGRLHVYVAAVAADGDGTDNGDRVYTFAGTISNIGTCSLAKAPALRTVVNGASFQPPFSSNAMISILGENFQVSGLTRSAGLGDLENNNTTFPTILGCVAVQVTGPGITKPVNLPIAYVQQDQINAQAPEFVGTGPVQLTVIVNPGQGNQLKSEAATLSSQQAFAPAFFLVPKSSTIAGQIGGTSIPLADPTLVPGGQKAMAGQIVTLYGTGFGDTVPATATGEIAPGAAKLANSITVKINGATLPEADVLYAGASPDSIGGLYQFNIRVPASTPAGDIPVVISIGGSQTQMNVTIPVAN